MRLFDASHPFFRPLAVRIGILVVCFGGALFEWSNDAQIWAIVFGALGLASAYEFFINPANKADPKDDN